MNHSSVCRDMMIQLSTPGEEKYLEAHDDEDDVQRAWLLLGKNASCQADILFRFEKLLEDHNKLVTVHKVCEKSFAKN